MKLTLTAARHVLVFMTVFSCAAFAAEQQQESNPISAALLIGGIWTVLWGITVFLVKRELSRQDDQNAEVRKALFGFADSAGLRERVSYHEKELADLKSENMRLEAKIEALSEKLDKNTELIVTKLDGLTNQLSIYHTQIELAKATIINLDARIKDIQKQSRDTLTQ